MKRNLNKLTSKHIENFLIKAETGNIQKTDFGVSYSMFEHLDDRKRVIAFLRSEGHDPFKRGTKEPRAIEITLSNTLWDTIKEIDPKTANVIGLFD